LAGTLETPAYPQAHQCRPPHLSSAATDDARPAATSDALFFSFTVEKEFVSIVVVEVAKSEWISR
jgi:hypothetical protein